MKILFLSHYSFLYGSNRSLDSLIDFFIEKGHNVEVLLPTKGEFYHHLEKKNVKVHAFMFLYEVLYYKWNKKYLSLPLLWIYDLLSFPLLIFVISRISPSIIYTNSSADLFSVIVSIILGKKHVMHVREFMEEDFGGRCIFGRKAKRKIILKSDKIICVSKAVAESVISDIPTYCKVIYNGLPTKTANYNYPDLKKKMRIGVVGNLDVSKQQDLAISYMPRILSVYPYATLHIIGDKECPYKRRITKQVSDLNIEKNVIFEGFIRDVEEIYNKFDILLMCSRSEAFGRVTIEAMLRKKPVIGYMAGGTSELIEEGVTGFKFKNVDDVLNALGSLLGDGCLMQQMIDNAERRAKLYFSEDYYTNNVYGFVMDNNWK